MTQELPDLVVPPMAGAITRGWRRGGAWTPRTRLVAGAIAITLTLLQLPAAEASHLGAPSGAAGSAGAPAGRILESFHSDLATGRAVFGIPLAVPPGRRGVQPNLALTYSSSARNGPVGVGWTLELGSIERSTRFGLPKFDSSDTYVLRFGGAVADLVEVSPAEYRLKDEQLFARIRLSGGAWTLTAKDGTTVTFGSTPDSQQVFTRGTQAWFLSEIRDVHGNLLTVTYAPSGRQVYPASIRYTAHPATGLAPAQEVRFLWEPRPDVEWDERFGDRIETRQRLASVETYHHAKLVRRYQLTYKQSALTNRSLLATVTTIGSDGTTPLPPITLTYTDSAPGTGWGAWTFSDAWAYPPPGLPTLSLAFLNSAGTDMGFRLEDLSGDGRVDLLMGKGSDLRSWRNTGTGWEIDNRWAPPHPLVIEVGGGDLGCRLIDLNGDGRVDLLYAGKQVKTAYLNTGSGWKQDNSWNTGTPFDTESIVGNEGKDLGWRFADLNGDGKTDALFSRDHAIGDGEATTPRLRAYLNTGAGWKEAPEYTPQRWFLDGNYRDTGTRLLDLNGDGLTDLFCAGTQLTYRLAFLNTGAGWKEDPITWNLNPAGEPGEVYFLLTGSYGQDYGLRPLDVNGDGLTDFVQNVDFKNEIGTPQKRVFVNTGNGWKRDDRFQVPIPFILDYKPAAYAPADINGDGMTDALYGGYGLEPQAHLWTNPAKNPPATPPDLLAQVDNGLGGTTTLAYRPSTTYDNTGGDTVGDLPFVTQTVASQTTSNGRGWAATTQFTYSGGKYSGADREFLGFAYARVTDPVGSTAESWFHQDVHLKGRPYKQELRGPADPANPSAPGPLFSRTENSWACTDLFTTGSGQKVHFCHLAGTSSTVFDADDTSKQTKADYTYDDYGNVTQTVEHGDTAVLGDERTTSIEYAHNPTTWRVGFPCHSVVTDATGTKLSEAWVTYDGNAAYTTPPTRGLPTKSEAWLSTGPANPVSTATYDPYGNKLSSTDPLGRITTTTYDGQATFPVQVTNTLGHTLKTTYDPGTGGVLTTTDPNGQVTQNRYDALGRLTAVVGPEDSDASPSVRYEYDLTSRPTRVTKQTKFAQTAPFGSSGYYTTHSFSDGLGRVIQTRAPAEDPAQQIVSGNAELGPRGEVIAQVLPYFAPASGACTPPAADIPKVRYEYDAIGRLTKITDPDGAVTTTAYSDWTVTLTDARGNSTTRESDAYGRLVKVTEPATADHPAATTLYAYDPAGRLAQVTDAKGNLTRITYDSLGRKLSMTDPDMGTWSYAYDLAGNLTRQTDAKGQILEFSYDALNRLIQKTGAVRAEPVEARTILATYSYDDPAKPNGIGRLSKVTDPTGSTEFFYDLLGRETKTVKTVNSFSYTVQREYDPLNRLTRLIYPDGTDLRYAYSPQGIERISTVQPDGSAQDLLTNADYNSSGETLKLERANGTTTRYAYDPQTLRISAIQTTHNLGQTLQDFTYSFDPAGNLTTLTDRRNTASQSFTYDALNRLATGSGSYGPFSFRYDPTGNLLTKDAGITLSYGAPDGTRPHAVRSLRAPVGGEAISLSYDPNGNLTQKGQDQYSYDLENRLVQVARRAYPPFQHGNHLTAYNGISSTSGKVGNAAQFNPSKKRYLSRTSTSDLALGDLPLTIAGWVRLNGSLSNTMDLAAKGENLPATGEYRLFYNGAEKRFSFSVYGEAGPLGAVKANQLGAPAKGKWYFLAAWHDPKTGQIGIRVNNLSPDTTTVPGPARKGTGVFSLGASGVPATRFLDGKLDELGVWRKVLTAAERTDLYNAGNGNTYRTDLHKFSVDTQGTLPHVLAAYYKLEEPSGTRTDCSEEPANPPTDSIARMVYDGDGGRVQLTTPSGTTTFIGQLYERLPGSTTRAHVFFGATRLATLERTPLVIASAAKQSHSFLARADDFLTRATPRKLRRALAAVEEFFVGRAYADIGLPPGLKLHYYHPDHLGSVNLITDHTGAQVRLQEFTPFGSTVRAEPVEARTPFAFTGKRLDSSTGLYYFGARYYDPELGRFIQPDTIVQAPSDPQTLNRYTYVRNNPLIYTDPTGHSFWKKVGRALGAIGRVIVSAVVAAVTFVATGGNIPAAAAAFSFTNTFLNASAQGASFGRALWASAVMATAAYFGANYALGAGPFAGALIGAYFGAAGSAASAAILGGSPGRAALSGAVGGAILGGAAGANLGLPGFVAAAAGAGAASAAVANQDPGEGAYLGAIGAVTFAVASASIQAAIDAGRAQSGIQADSNIASRFADRAMQPRESGVARAISQELRAPAIHALKVNIGLDIAGLIGSVVSMIPTPFTYIAGTAVSVIAGAISTSRVYGQYKAGWASGWDVAVSGGTTAAGFHPQAGVAAGVGQLAYDAYQLYDVSTKE